MSKKPDFIKGWEHIGSNEPHWGVLTQEQYKKEVLDKEVFYQTGSANIARIVKRIGRRHDLNFGSALDFGCGVGRLSFGLAEHFDKVSGVDISPGMLEQANLAKGDDSNVEFFYNQEPNLGLFESNQFDLVLTMITLQHMPLKWMKIYLKEMARVLKPGGVLYFQVPSEPSRINLSSRLARIPFVLQTYYKLRQFQSKNTIMEMHGFSNKKLKKFLKQLGLKKERIRKDNHAGEEWNSYTYFYTKPI